MTSLHVYFCLLNKAGTFTCLQTSFQSDNFYNLILCFHCENTTPELQGGGKSCLPTPMHCSVSEHWRDGFEVWSIELETHGTQASSWQNHNILAKQNNLWGNKEVNAHDKWEAPLTQPWLEIVKIFSVSLAAQAPQMASHPPQNQSIHSVVCSSSANIFYFHWLYLLELHPKLSATANPTLNTGNLMILRAEVLLQLEHLLPSWSCSLISSRYLETLLS